MSIIALMFFSLVLGSLGYFATDIYLPSLPAISAHFGNDDSLAQLSIATYMVSFAISPLLFGPLSDYYGRKRVILGGLTIALVSTVAAIFSPNIYSLMFYRFTQGIGTGAVVVASRIMLPDSFKGAELAKYVSFVPMFMPIVLAVAPAVGGVIEEHFDWQANFIFMSAFIAFLFIITKFFLQETNKNPHVYDIKSHFKAYKILITNPGFIGFSLCSSIVSFGIGAYLTASPFLFQKLLGLSPAQFGYAFSSIALGIIASSFINKYLTSIIDIRKILIIGANLTIISGVLLIINNFTWQSTFGLLLPCILFFTSMPLLFPNSIPLAYQCITHNYGTAGAIILSSQLALMGIGAAIFSFMPLDSFIGLALAFITSGIVVNYIAKLSIRKSAHLFE